MDLIGKTLGKYQILEELGRGGMGVVYKAYDATLDRHVALKVLAPHLVWEQEFVQRFMREARAAAKLDHSNIATIHEVGQADDLYYFVMAYVSGTSLARLIAEKGALPIERVLSIAQQVAAALDYAHDQGLVHRDIKSSNIMVDERGRAVLTDFGLVRATEGTRLTSAGVTLGTPEYMSPEQVRGEEATASSDIYALAVVVYEMLVGAVPFQAPTPSSVLVKHMLETPPSLRTRNPQVTEQVEQVVLQALAKDAARRPASGALFVSMLKEAAGISAIPLPGGLTPPAGLPAVTAPAPQTPVEAAPVVAPSAPEAPIHMEPTPAPPAQITPVQAAAAVPPPAQPTPAVIPAATPPEATPAASPSMPPSAGQPAADPAAAAPAPSPPSGFPVTPAAAVPAVAAPRLRRRWPAWARALVVILAILVVAAGVLVVLALTGVWEGPFGFLAAATPTPDVEATAAAQAQATAAAVAAICPVPGQRGVRSADGMEIVCVPAGEFAMGSDEAALSALLQECPTCEQAYFVHERPLHTVYLDPFWIDRTEVTNAQYRLCVEAGNCSAPTTCDWGSPTYDDPAMTDHPVVCVDWQAAQAYCQWAGGRLPTEAEWEYAARGPSGSTYPWGDSFDCRMGNFDDENALSEYVVPGGVGCDGSTRTALVGSYSPGASWCGAEDLGGNAWEWVADWYGRDYYNLSPAENPTGPATGNERVVRGGGWTAPSWAGRAASRLFIEPVARGHDLGFRCVVPAR